MLTIKTIEYIQSSWCSLQLLSKYGNSTLFTESDRPTNHISHG